MVSLFFLSFLFHFIIIHCPFSFWNNPNSFAKSFHCFFSSYYYYLLLLLLPLIGFFRTFNYEKDTFIFIRYSYTKSNNTRETKYTSKKNMLKTKFPYIDFWLLSDNFSKTKVRVDWFTSTDSGPCSLWKQLNEMIIIIDKLEVFFFIYNKSVNHNTVIFNWHLIDDYQSRTRAIENS